MFKTVIFSFKKSRILSKIASELRKRRFDSYNLLDKTMKEIVQGKTMSKRELYIEQLLALLAKDSFTTDLLAQYRRNFEDVRKIIATLERIGTGQIVKGHYVAVSSIAFLSQLRFILEHWNGENFAIDGLDAYNSNLKMAYYLLMSFK